VSGDTRHFLCGGGRVSVNRKWVGQSHLGVLGAVELLQGGDGLGGGDLEPSVPLQRGVLSAVLQACSPPQHRERERGRDREKHSERERRIGVTGDSDAIL